QRHRFNAPMFTLNHVVPWGRSFDEYTRMFALTDADLRRRVVGCADGPASFNAEATTRGFSVVSCDPLYRFTGDQVRARIDATAGGVHETRRRNAHEFVGDPVRSVGALAALRTGAMTAFLADFDAGRRAGRYVVGALPRLPFGDRTFNLALCSH